MGKFRQSKSLNLPDRILVLCEGESEIIYLKGYRSENSNKRRLTGLEIEIYQPNDFSPLGLLHEAKRKIKEAKRDKYPYKEVWIVFDRDGHANVSQAINEANGFNPIIKVAFSLVCFEYWILLHFEKSRKLYNTCEQVKKVIENKYIPNYSKTMNFYPLVKERMDTALGNAEWLHDQNRFELESGTRITDLQAYTSFDTLINFLQSINNYIS